MGSILKMSLAAVAMVLVGVSSAQANDKPNPALDDLRQSVLQAVNAHEWAGLPKTACGLEGNHHLNCIHVGPYEILPDLSVAILGKKDAILVYTQDKGFIVLGPWSDRMVKDMRDYAQRLSIAETGKKADPAQIERLTKEYLAATTVSAAKPKAQH
jgi:hypothetical protein